jgi:hypothetical protein
MGFGYGFLMGFGSRVEYRGKFLGYVGDGDPHQVPVPRWVRVRGKSSHEVGNGLGTGMGRFSLDRGGSREPFSADIFRNN